MRRSRLEVHIDILRVLARYGPLKPTHIMYKANINCDVLQRYTDFLIERNLIELRKEKGDRVVYAITQNGINVLKQLRELKQALPIEDEFSEGPKNSIQVPTWFH